MDKTLAKQFDKLEKQRHQLLDKVRQFPAVFNQKPNANKWSVHEILAHLITAEKLSVQYIEKKQQGIDTAGNTGMIEELKMGILRISQRLPLRFTAPKLVVAATHSYSSIEDLTADWNNVRENLKHVLEQIQENQLKKKIYKHIIVGRLNIVHAIKFLQEHVAHHWPQVIRLLK
ncbi:MAG TPA: DinB family protein [Cyclobacteriaceae bacterium]